MNNVILNPKVIIATVTATTTSNWIPLDCNYCGSQKRSISGFRSDSNCPVKLLTKTAVNIFDKNGAKSSTVEVTATVTTWAVSGRNYFSTGIVLPATHLRVIKTNASGSATIVGVI